jgi:hypothetical protein
MNIQTGYLSAFIISLFLFSFLSGSQCFSGSKRTNLE